MTTIEGKVRTTGWAEPSSYAPVRESAGIEDLLWRTVRMGASDLHLKVDSPPALRIDGELNTQLDLQPLTADDVQAMLKQLTNHRQWEEFSYNLELDFSYTLPDVARFRINAGKQRGTITVVCRRLSLTIPAMDDLGLPEVCKDLVMKPRGLILVTGPTGHGKSTTLASMIQYLNERQPARVITIEDPIEYVFEDQRCLITQRELGVDTHSFASALKHALRQDPDVILVGEMRDLETISTALTAAETGHLVLSTLHTVSAPLTIDRIIDVFPPHQQQQVRIQLAGIIEGVISQTLLPRADGQGRILASEVMIGTAAIRNMIRESKTHQLYGVMETGSRVGMQTLDGALVQLFKEGKITLDDALSKAGNPGHLRQLIEALEAAPRSRGFRAAK
jgi:twitching motility protein PilT